jgi:hypothetical protein
METQSKLTVNTHDKLYTHDTKPHDAVNSMDSRLPGKNTSTMGTKSPQERVRTNHFKEIQSVSIPTT